MELNYSTLKTKEVINVNDGHRLGKTKDVVFTYPEGKISGIVVPDGRFRFGKSDLYIDLCCVVKIGEDVVLVDIKGVAPQSRTQSQQISSVDRRSYDEYE